jgi:UDP-glucose 4-epimerase
MRKAIVTGANGFVGAAVVNELSRYGYEVYAIGHNNHFDRLSNKENIHCISCDLTNFKTLGDFLPSQEYDLFYHFAWDGSAGKKRGDTVLQLQNVQWTIDAVQTASDIGCKRFVGAGSIMEYEAVEALNQLDAVGIGNIYGSSKLTAHIMGLVKAKQLGIDFGWGVITNIYGPGEISPRLVNTSIRKCIRGVVPEFTSGTQNYDFVYIDDAARAFRLIGEGGKSCREYLIGSSHAGPLKSFLLEMQRALAPDLSFKFGNVPFKGISLPLQKFDCSQTENDTGFKAKISFYDGCRRTAEWWKSQDMI